MNSSFEEELRRHGNLIYTNLGKSMMPLLRENRDLIILKPPAGRLQKYDVPLYRRDGGQYVLHRILKVREEDYVLCGDHCYRREYGITDRHIIGVMTGFVRDGVTWSVQDKRYQMYVHLWCDAYYIRAGILWLKNILKRIRRKIKRK